MNTTYVFRFASMHAWLGAKCRPLVARKKHTKALYAAIHADAQRAHLSYAIRHCVQPGSQHGMHLGVVVLGDIQAYGTHALLKVLQFRRGQGGLVRVASAAGAAKVVLKPPGRALEMAAGRER